MDTKFPQSRKIILWFVAVFLAIGAGVAFFWAGSGGLLSQFSGFNVTPQTASSIWQPTPSNPYRANIANFSNRIDDLVVLILARGSNLPRDRYVTFLNNLTVKFEAMRVSKEYALNDEVSAIIKYLNYELMDAVRTFSQDANGFDRLIDIVNTTAYEMSVNGGTLYIYRERSELPEIIGNLHEKDAYGRCIELVRLPANDVVTRCTWEAPCPNPYAGKYATGLCLPPEARTTQIYPVEVPTVNSAVGILGAPSGEAAIGRSLFLAGSKNQKLASFTVTAQNDSIKLKDIRITGVDDNQLFNLSLTDSKGNLIGRASKSNSGEAMFTNLNVPSLEMIGDGLFRDVAVDSIPQDSTATYYVVADIKSYFIDSIPDSAVDARDDDSGVHRHVGANVALEGSSIVGSRGGTVPMSTISKVISINNGITGTLHDVARNTFKVAQIQPTNKNLATDAMEFTVYAYGKDKVTLSSAAFNNVLSGYAGGTLTIVRKSDNVTVGTGSGSTGKVQFNTGATVDANFSSTFVVKLVGAIATPSNTAPDWSIQMTNLYIGGLDAANYPRNAETFPLVSVK